MTASAANNAEFNPSPLDPLHVSFNDKHLNKTLWINPNTGQPDGTSGFYAAEPTPDALVRRILKGHAWTACEIKLRSQWREANVLRVNTLTLDLDGDITLGDFWQLPVARRHCLFTATSCSHGNLERQREKGAETSDCFQAVFTTGRTVRPEVVPHLYDVLCERLGHVPVDDHGRKPEALWFGNTQAQVNENPSAVPLPWDWVAEAEHRLEQERQRQALRDSQVSPEDQRLLLERCKAVLRLGLIPDPGPGNYGIWMRVMHAAASGNDGDLLEAFREWSSGTHHGKREQRRLERRLRGAGRKSDPAALLAMAKEADPNWIEKLPQELQPQKRPQVVSLLSNRSATPMVLEDINVAMPPIDREDEDEQDGDLPDRPQPTVLFSSPRLHGDN
jgi:hypothetical protein